MSAFPTPRPTAVALPPGCVHYPLAEGALPMFPEPDLQPVIPAHDFEDVVNSLTAAEVLSIYPEPDPHMAEELILPTYMAHPGPTEDLLLPERLTPVTGVHVLIATH